MPVTAAITSPLTGCPRRARPDDADERGVLGSLPSDTDRALVLRSWSVRPGVQLVVESFELPEPG